MRLHALADDGVWYVSEVLKVSRTKQGKARVKVLEGTKGGPKEGGFEHRSA